jgi:intracellular septation protein
VLFGGATLALQDDTFIRGKPTVLYGLFAAILAVGKVAFGRNLIGYLLKGVSLPDFVWTRLTWAWTGFLALMALANLYVAYSYPLDVWVNFKVWGGIGLALAFALAQGFWLSRYLAEENA